tara:strand:+ start:1408 stop:1872 length:465 start_codon:yes stop_codon:yes gene_type:complete
MKNIKLFEEFVTEATGVDSGVAIPGLKKMAKRFKQAFYDREASYYEEEDIDANFKFITDFLGTDQIVEIAGGDHWADHPAGKELTDIYYGLVAKIKNRKDHELDSGSDYITGTLNGAKVVSQYDGYSTPSYLSIMISVNDIKKFDIKTTPFLEY